MNTDWLSSPLLMLVIIALPFAGAVLIRLAKHFTRLREAVSISIATLTLLAVSRLFWLFTHGTVLEIKLMQIMPGLQIGFSLEPLGMLFALIVAFLWIVSSIYSISYLHANREHNQPRFMIAFAMAIGSALGIAMSGNMLTLFIFYEMLTLSTYPLVTHHQTETAKQAGRTYLGILLGTSIVLLLPALIWVWIITGTLDFTRGGILFGSTDPATTGILLALFTFGIAKAAVMPMHRWLPAAMVAPAPVSALLHAVAVVKAGVFTFVKVLIYIFGTEFLKGEIAMDWRAGGWLPYLAGTTIILASVVALKQDNLKKRLAYSTISQLSYIIMAAALLSPKALTGAIFHIAAHAFGKITLFFAAGAIYTASHKENIREMGGIGRRMPWTMGAFTIGALSMIGIPPAAGFISKWYMLSGALESSSWFAVAVILVSTILNALYFLPIIYIAFFRGDVPTKEGRMVEHGEAPFPMVYALVITAIMTVWLFVQPDVFLIGRS